MPGPAQPAPPSREWALVGYTLLAQAAAGVCLVLFLAQVLLAIQAGPDSAWAWTFPVFLAAGPLVALAVLASLLHLGNPGNAWRALANLRTSWLSREILFTLLLSAGWAFTAGLEILPAPPPAWRWGGMVFTTASSAGLLVCMVRLYSLRTVPAWNRPTTALAFLTTALLLGSMGTAAALAALAPDEALPFSLELTLTVLVLLSFGAAILQERNDNREDAEGGARPVRLILIGTGSLLMVYSLNFLSSRLSLLGPAFALALLGEILARARFYPRRLRPEARWYKYWDLPH